MKVNVLLSAYNGERFIEEQIKSVMEQTGIDVDLYLRDDGSSDLTPSILDKYATIESIHILRESNCGVNDSFWKLLKTSRKADYYAFCDQDDRWMPEKLSKAVEKLSKIEGPGLYIGNVILADENMKPLSLKPKLMNPADFSPERCVVPHGDRVLGCTMVWNNALQQVILDRNLNVYYAHDQHLWFIAAMVGQVIFDSTPYMYYRQHSNNVAAAMTYQGKIRQYRKKLKTAKNRFFETDNKKSRDIEMRNREMLERCSDLISNELIQLLKLSIESNSSIKARFRLLKQDCCKTLSFKKKMRVLIGKL